MANSPITVRPALASDFFQVLATLTEVPGRLTLTPDQLNWVLKECENPDSAYRGWIAIGPNARIAGVLIGKQKNVDERGQFEILFLESSAQTRGETFPALIETLCESGSKNIGPEVVVFVPETEANLGTLYQRAGFQVHGGVPGYYADGSNAEIWTRRLETSHPSGH